MWTTPKRPACGGRIGSAFPWPPLPRTPRAQPSRAPLFARMLDRGDLGVKVMGLGTKDTHAHARPEETQGIMTKSSRASKPFHARPSPAIDPSRASKPFRASKA
ncbi:hypothetical protein MIC448_2520001 [Microbacterium sp. C448]|nr:hypothetical protein MIC448_2520001 [Microbacterium sp. C448]